MKTLLQSLLLCHLFTAPVAANDNRIILDAQGVQNLRLEMVEAAETDFAKTILALGRIEVFPGKRQIISSRIPGRVLHLKVKPDQVVQKGQELLSIESRQPGDPPPSIVLTASMDGTIASLNIAPGQPLSADDSLLEIVDLKEVHAMARVPEHLVSKLKIGQVANIRVPAFPEQVFEAKLEHIAALADPQTGTLEAAFHVPNPESLLRPGMRAEFSIVTSSRSDVMAVPREAIQGEGPGRFVYIADYDLKHAFLKTPVVIGEQNDTLVEILNGLLPGDEVVTRGAYALGFAGKGSVSLKEALDAAHGHPHAEDGSELSETDDHDHDHDHGPHPISGFNTFATFFAALSAMLLVLLILSLCFRKPATE